MSFKEDSVQMSKMSKDILTYFSFLYSILIAVLEIICHIKNNFIYLYIFFLLFHFNQSFIKAKIYKILRVNKMLKVISSTKYELRRSHNSWLRFYWCQIPLDGSNQFWNMNHWTWAIIRTGERGPSGQMVMMQNTTRWL